MTPAVRSVERDGRTLILDAMNDDGTTYVFECLADGEDLIGTVTQRDDGFEIECFWIRQADGSRRIDDFDLALGALLELAETGALASESSTLLEFN